jgi:hypothetical protein
MWCVVDQNEATTQGGAGGGGGGGGINSGCGYHHRMYRVVVLPPPPPPPPPPPGTTGGGGAMLLEGSSWEQDESDGCIGAKPALSGRPVSDLLIAKWWSDQFPKTGSGQKNIRQALLTKVVDYFSHHVFRSQWHMGRRLRRHREWI